VLVYALGVMLMSGSAYTIPPSALVAYTSQRLLEAQKQLHIDPKDALYKAQKVFLSRSAVKRGLAFTLACQAAIKSNQFRLAHSYGMQALEVLPHDQPLARAKALLAFGIAQFRLGDYQVALESLTEANTLFYQVGDQAGIIETSEHLGNTYCHLEQAEQALVTLETVLYLPGISAFEQARLHCEMGHAYVVYKDKATSQDDIEFYTNAIFEQVQVTSELLPQIPQDMDLTSIHNRLVRLLADVGQIELVKQLHLSLLETALLEDHPGNTMYCTHSLGWIYFDEGDFASSEDCSRESLKIAEGLEDLEYQHGAYQLLEHIFEQRGDFKSALEASRKAQSIESTLRGERAQRQATLLAHQQQFNRFKHQNKTYLARNAELEQLVRSRTHELELAHLEMLERLAIAAEYRDDETGQHTRRVSDCVGLMARELGLSPEEAHRLQIASRLHDIGKIAVSDRILLKVGRLTRNEWSKIREHALVGAQILGGSNSELLRLAEEIALTHHERWDGTGYPRGLSGSAIPLSGRITAVADVYDALRQERPYKPAWGREQALQEIQRLSGSHFDPTVVSAFLETARDVL
jgi:response regulator RpfG family c-di-GMP phosphodiesterase